MSNSGGHLVMSNHIKQGPSNIQLGILGSTETRAPNNPWPTWPKVFKLDYGHEEVELKFGRDPRIFNIKSTVSVK
jgi:hypothetical protein